MKFLKKLFGNSADEDVILTFDVPQFSPQEDITAYEVALHLVHTRGFVFTGNPQKFQNDIMEWHHSLPPALPRHYKFVKRTIRVSKNLVSDL